MTISTHEMYQNGTLTLEVEPEWLPEMFVCKSCNPEELLFVTHPLQKEHELCYKCMRDKGII